MNYCSLLPSEQLVQNNKAVGRRESEGKVFGLPLSKLAAERVDRLLSRTPDIDSLGLLSTIVLARKMPGEMVDLHKPEIDAITALYQVLHAEPDIDHQEYDNVIDVLIGKIKTRRGLSRDAAQIQDLAYEAQMALCLKGLRWMSGLG